MLQAELLKEFGGHDTYSPYDAAGNITAVDSDSTATYVYNALNHKVSGTVSGSGGCLLMIETLFHRRIG